VLSPLVDEVYTIEVGPSLGRKAEKTPGDHNRYRCKCEMPGFFSSGVPGILAHLENGRLPAGAKVERCDLCRRYDSDEAALQKLKVLGHVGP
jgi:hypothetical protein